MSKVLGRNAGNIKGGNTPVLAARQLNKKSVIDKLQNEIMRNNKKSNTLPGMLDNKHIRTGGSLLNRFKTNNSEKPVENIPGIPKAIKQDETILQEKLNRGPKPFIENYEDSFYIAVAIALKSVLRYIWEFLVISVKSAYKLFSDLVLTPFFIFLPYLFDVTAVIIITICIILLIIYFISGGSKRKSNNMFDNIFNGFKGLVLPKFTLYDKNKVDDYKDEATGLFSFFTAIGDAINETIFKSFLRMFIVNPNLDDIGEENQHIRNHKTEGRCDNIGLIESKDGRYCYEQLDEKHIEWNNQKIPYKLLEKKDKGDNTHFDYYVPNCKGSNLFTREFITTCKDSKRTKFVCKL